MSLRHEEAKTEVGELRQNASMFEFHGWVTVRDTATQDDGPLVAEATVDSVRRLLAHVAEVAEFVGGLADLRLINGEWHVPLHGVRNHRKDQVIHMYRDIARAAPGSYGLLHVHDDEAEDDSRWVCWSMVRGRTEASTEVRLTPHFGRVEDVPSYYDD